MNEKELVGKLNSFKNIKLDSDYKAEARDILYNQISSSSDNFVIHNIALPQKVFGYIAQPIWAVFFAVLIIGGGIFSVGASRYMNPSDSLYIAKLISNKAHLAITFNENKKTKLGIKFANDYAKDITKAMVSGEVDKDGEEASRLSENFKRQISSVRSKLKEIKVAQEGTEDMSINTEDEQIFSANAGRDNDGMQVSDSSVVKTQEEVEVPEVSANDVATSTDEIKEEDSSFETAEKILDEAESLFDEENYSGTLNKLDEAEILINEVTSEEGDVKGVSEENETASSTDVNN